MNPDSGVISLDWIGKRKKNKKNVLYLTQKLHMIYTVESKGLCKEKIAKIRDYYMEVGGWVQFSLGFLCGKSSQK